MKKSFSRATGLFLVLTLIFSLCSLQPLPRLIGILFPVLTSGLPCPEMK